MIFKSLLDRQKVQINFPDVWQVWKMIEKYFESCKILQYLLNFMKVILGILGDF